MKKLILIALALVGAQLLSVCAHADAEANEIQSCLRSWGKTPFTANSPFRVISAKVKVMGIGGNIDESVKTAAPELVLVRPAVSVMSKATMTLDNPNGWYCLRGKVTVLGKTQINLNCKAHLASSDGATVLGGSDESTGTTVLGSTRIVRLGACSK